jgi:methylphosphotriester-DNA--protein-cysteine methyltransferase
MPSEALWLAFHRTIESTIRRSPQAHRVPSMRQCASRFPRCAPDAYRFIQTAVGTLYATQGHVRMQDLAAQCGLSLRHFERQFKALTGISPKLLARIIRFEGVVYGLLQGLPLDDLAHDFGYTDQSHLIHDFKAFAGCAPQQFLERARRRHEAGFICRVRHEHTSVSRSKEALNDRKATALARHSSYCVSNA